MGLSDQVCGKGEVMTEGLCSDRGTCLISLFWRLCKRRSITGAGRGHLIKLWMTTGALGKKTPRRLTRVLEIRQGGNLLASVSRGLAEVSRWKVYDRSVSSHFVKHTSKNDLLTP